jgi:GntR family transcriptional regulator
MKSSVVPVEFDTDFRSGAGGGLALNQQVLAVLTNQIANGEYRVGDKLPTEGDLADYFGMSRVTIRIALDVLERQGLIVRQRGRGTFLRQLPAARAQEMRRVRVDLAQLASVWACRDGHILRHRQARPPVVVSRELGLGPDDEASFFVKIFTDARGPRAGVKRFFAPSLEAAIGPAVRDARDFDAALGAAVGKPVRLSHGWIEAILAEPHLVMILDVPVGTALLSAWWVSSIDGVPAIVTQMLYPGDRMSVGFDGEQT